MAKPKTTHAPAQHDDRGFRIGLAVLAVLLAAYFAYVLLRGGGRSANAAAADAYNGI